MLGLLTVKQRTFSFFFPFPRNDRCCSTRPLPAKKQTIDLVSPLLRLLSNPFLFVYIKSPLFPSFSFFTPSYLTSRLTFILSWLYVSYTKLDPITTSSYHSETPPLLHLYKQQIRRLQTWLLPSGRCFASVANSRQRRLHQCHPKLTTLNNSIVSIQSMMRSWLWLGQMEYQGIAHKSHGKSTIFTTYNLLDHPLPKHHMKSLLELLPVLKALELPLSTV
ncbi:hypothetical protein BCR41DRAFT_358775, partial [Lobosporangium transversale]